jgi:DNA-binding response OmpR family regulator
LVSSEQDGETGLRTALAQSPDLMVLDLNLPNLDGFSILSQVRAARNSTRVLILTARSDIENRVKGLKAGADDYLTKPFAMEELMARIEALGRRDITAPSNLLQVAELQMDIAHRRVTRANQPITLSPREFDLLQVLMEEPGRVFSRTELCERVWQRDHEYDTRTVEIFIARLRKKLDLGPGPSLIQTIRSVGYTIQSQ